MSNPSGGTGPVDPVDASPESSVPPGGSTPTPLDPVAPPFSDRPVASESEGFLAPAQSVSGEPELPPIEPMPVGGSDLPPAEAATPAPPASLPPAPIYIQAPMPPKAKGNRWFGALIGLLGALIFGVVYAGIVFLWLFLSESSSAVVGAAEYFSTTWFVLPIIGFYLGFLLLAAVVNRGAWPGYVIGGFGVGLIAWLTLLGGALINQAWLLRPAEVSGFLADTVLSPQAIIVFIAAREVTIWVGAIVARRGAKVTIQNTEAKADYERRLAESPLGYAPTL